MNYELAKKLKDAGFPQKGMGYPCYKPNTKCIQGYDLVYTPTLEELIDACGDKLHSIHRGEKMNGEDVYCATLGYDYRKFIPNEDYREGKTYKEAVANLWLALNEK